MLASDSISSLPRTAPATKAKLKSIGVHTMWDLINLFPNRHEDYSKIVTTSRLRFEEKCTLQGSISHVSVSMTQRGARMLKAHLTDMEGSLELVWFNQIFLLNMLKRATFLSVSGQMKLIGRNRLFVPEHYELIPRIGLETIHTGRFIPIYPETRGLSSRTIREKMFTVLKSLTEQGQSGAYEYLSETQRASLQLINEWNAYEAIHFPSSQNTCGAARERLAFDEIFLIQLASRLKRLERESHQSHYTLTPTKESDARVSAFVQSLPFTLTRAQTRSISEILEDMSQSYPMHRLLQGDVGSGKTIVATVAAYFAQLTGYKTLLMAPTEILAKQHYQSIENVLALVEGSVPKVTLVTGTQKKSIEALHGADIIVGTHALLSKSQFLEKVALVIIDEQHKFGVDQRAQLAPEGSTPHVLTMSATPIPRTIALTLYGELEVSVLDEMPKTRKKTRTYIVPSHKRDDAYTWIFKKITSEKTQAFIVCPLIAASDHETLTSVRAAEEEIERIKTSVLGSLNIALMHGRLSSKKKQEAMLQFTEGSIDILISTPVVEVGIDVPNASILIIETPERFGLAQLHQLRGRVGRGSQEGVCLLFPQESEAPQKSRLSIFARTSDGFALAEKDLELRGAGQLYGTRQHGMPDLKMASLTDKKLIARSSQAVSDFMRRYTIDTLPDSVLSRLRTLGAVHAGGN